MQGFVVLLVLFGLMWALLIRPQQQRLRRQRALVASIGVGDEVVTAGGIVGRVVAMEDDRVILEVPPGPVQLTVLRLAINRKLVDEGSVGGGPVDGDEGHGASQDKAPDGQADEGSA